MYNAEHYQDSTAGKAISRADREGKALDRSVKALMFVLRFCIDKSGFELVNRIVLRDKQTGRTFR